MNKGSSAEKRYIIRKRGTIFCHVERIRHIGQEIEDMTAGNQKWQGGIPSLMRSPSATSRIENSLGITVCTEKYIFRAPDRRNPLPSAWLRKYFIAASLS